MIGGIGGGVAEADEVEHVDHRVARQRLEGVELRALRVDVMVGHDRNSLRLTRHWSALCIQASTGTCSSGAGRRAEPRLAAPSRLASAFARVFAGSILCVNSSHLRTSTAT